MENNFTVEAVEETLKKTTVGEFKQASPVNLELAMQLHDRIGGHLVLGHVDCVGTVTSQKQMKSSWLFEIKIPSEFVRTVRIGS